MRLTFDNLHGHLKRGMAPIYLIAGDEPLLAGEAADAVRAAARGAGFVEREVLIAETGFDWARLSAAGANLSLFGEKRLLELRIPTAKPGAAGAAALSAYAKRAAKDTLLLVLTGKLARGGRSLSWVKALEQTGVVVSIYPVAAKQLPAWIEHRLRQRGLNPSRAAHELIAARVEGNLLAASQEIDKLLLTVGPGELDLATAREAVADSARFDVFGLVDAALAGEGARVMHMLGGLHAEGVEPTLLCWALVRELRRLARLAFRLEQGLARDSVLADVWSTRRAVVDAALQRASANHWRCLLQRAGQVDRVVKGQLPGHAWQALTGLAAGMAGVGA